MRALDSLEHDVSKSVGIPNATLSLSDASDGCPDSSSIGGGGGKSERGGREGGTKGFESCVTTFCHRAGGRADGAPKSSTSSSSSHRRRHATPRRHLLLDLAPHLPPIPEQKFASDEEIFRARESSFPLSICKCHSGKTETESRVGRSSGSSRKNSRGDLEAGDAKFWAGSSPSTRRNA